VLLNSSIFRAGFSGNRNVSVTTRLPWEKNFGIKIPRGELFPENLTADESFVSDGQVTEDGIAQLRERLPHANLDTLAANPKVENIQDLFTVQMIVNFVEAKLA
jgi:acyl carrier protein